MIVIVSCAIENNLVYLRDILVGPMIVIVFMAIENNLVYFGGILAGAVIMMSSFILGVFWLGLWLWWVPGHIHWLAYDYDSFLGCWEITLFLRSFLVYDCDSFLGYLGITY